MGPKTKHPSKYTVPYNTRNTVLIPLRIEPLAPKNDEEQCFTVRLWLEIATYYMLNALEKSMKHKES